MTIAMLDADLIVYQCCAFAESKPKVTFGEDDAAKGSTLESTIATVEEKIKYQQLMARCDEVVLALSGDTNSNFRKLIHPDYKSARTTEKPEHYAGVLEYLKRNYKYRSRKILEGDDILGLAITSGKVDVIVSGDKDILTLPGRILHIVHKTKVQGPPRINTVNEADRYWMSQTLTGDSTDGYNGCPGIGPAGVTEILGRDQSQGLHEMWYKVVQAYERQSRHKRWGNMFNGWSPYSLALANARCARILRDGDYSESLEQVVLWNP